MFFTLTCNPETQLRLTRVTSHEEIVRLHTVLSEETKGFLHLFADMQQYFPAPGNTL